MSVLLVGGPRALRAAVVGRLVDQGDEVRVVEDGGAPDDELSALGAFVARGAVDDFDLIERAAQNVRTIVVLDERVELEPVIRGASAAAVDRIVCVGARVGSDVTAIEAARLDYVILEVPPESRWRRGRRLAPTAIADAVDAADDLADGPRLVLDLSAGDGWRQLGLVAPEGI